MTMKASQIVTVIAVFTIYLFGCAQGNCRSQIQGTGAPMAEPVNPSDRVKVFKYDGSLQCGAGSAISLEDMAKDLKNMKIYNSFNKSDGLMHITQCGTPTGKANVYEIDRQNLAQAQKSGFKEWLWE